MVAKMMREILWGWSMIGNRWGMRRSMVSRVMRMERAYLRDWMVSAMARAVSGLLPRSPMKRARSKGYRAEARVALADLLKPPEGLAGAKKVVGLAGILDLRLSGK